MGAMRSDVLRLVGSRVIRLAAAGIVCGIFGALLLTRLMKTLLYGVSPTDTQTFLLSSGLLVLVALAAAYIPARRAAKVDPVVTLRYE
jgi:ABC-type antimicrobial peptide transport system permease subunit